MWRVSVILVGPAPSATFPTSYARHIHPPWQPRPLTIVGKHGLMIEIQRGTFTNGFSLSSTSLPTFPCAASLAIFFFLCQGSRDDVKNMGEPATLMKLKR